MKKRQGMLPIFVLVKQLQSRTCTCLCPVMDADGYILRLNTRRPDTSTHASHALASCCAVWQYRTMLTGAMTFNANAGT